MVFAQYDTAGVIRNGSKSINANDNFAIAAANDNDIVADKVAA